MNKNCPKCGEQWPATARVCFTCGHRFTDVEQRPATGLRRTGTPAAAPRPPVRDRTQSPLHHQIHRSLLIAMFIGILLTAAYIIYQWSESYTIEGLPYIPLGYTAVAGFALLKAVDYIFYAVDFNDRCKQFQGLPEFLYRKGIMRSVRGSMTYLILAIVVGVVFPVFSFSIGVVDIPPGLPLSLTVSLLALFAYHVGFIGYLAILKRREGLSSMASRITRTFDPNRDYGLIRKVKNSISPESNIALDRQTEVAWQIERYTYLGMMAIALIFMVERGYAYGVGPLADGFPWRWIFLIFVALLIILRFVYLFFRHREISRIPFADREDTLKALVVSGFKRGVFVLVGLIVIIIFTSIDSSLAGGMGEDAPPFQLSLLMLTSFILLSECLWLLDLYWLKQPPKEKPKENVVVEDVFLVDTSGNLLTHHARRLTPDMDDDILMGMFTAIQDFMAETFRNRGTGPGNLNTLHYGEFKILIEHGEHAYIAMVIRGDETPELRKSLQSTIRTIHRKYSSILEDWSGSTDDLTGINKEIKALISEQIQ